MPFWVEYPKSTGFFETHPPTTRAEFDDVPPVGGRLSPHPGRRLRHRTSEWDPPQTVVSPLGEKTVVFASGGREGSLGN